MATIGADAKMQPSFWQCKSIHYPHLPRLPSRIPRLPRLPSRTRSFVQIAYRDWKRFRGTGRRRLQLVRLQKRHDRVATQRLGRSRLNEKIWVVWSPPIHRRPQNRVHDTRRKIGRENTDCSSGPRSGQVFQQQLVANVSIISERLLRDLNVESVIDYLKRWIQ